MRPVFFATAADLRAWLGAHPEEAELWVGFHKKGSGLGGLTYPEALDEALCAGWIDGVRRRIDESDYAIRFTPRTPRSQWSEVNMKRAGELIAAGRMLPRGVEAFRAGVPLDARPEALDADLEARFRADPGAWEFFQAQPPSYRRNAILWVMSARREDTRTRRLSTLRTASAAGKRVDLLAPGRPPS